jgi:hypothetical protein
MAVFINPETGRVFEEGDQIRTRTAFQAFLQRIADSDDPVQLFYNSSETREMVAEFADNGEHLRLHHCQVDCLRSTIS